MTFSEDLTGQVFNCIFENNISGTHGGAVACYGGSMTISGCRFLNNQAPEGGAVSIEYALVQVEDCTFQGNTAEIGGGLYLKSPYLGFMTGCTFSGNAADQGGAVAVLTIPINPIHFSACIMAGSTIGEGLYWDGGNDLVLTSCDIFGNTGGDWVGAIEGALDDLSNFQLDPLFCDEEAGNFTLAANSPCLAPNNPGGVQVGAWGLGCGVSPVNDLPDCPLAIGCYPNPFNPYVHISFTLGRGQPVRVEIFDLSGRRVARLNRGTMAAGPQRVTWNGRATDGLPVPSGSYLVRVGTAEGTAFQKVLLLK